MVRSRFVGPRAGTAGGRAQRRNRRRGGARLALSARPRTALKGVQGLGHGLEQAHQANENSWAFTEPAIYYQARYVLLLASSSRKEKPGNMQCADPVCGKLFCRRKPQKVRYA